MELQHVPWKEGVTAVFAAVLLKILYDCVYVKLPMGFRSVRKTLLTQTQLDDKRHGEHIAKLASLEDAISLLVLKGANAATRRAAAKRKTKSS